jgi:hypothetical protein
MFLSVVLRVITNLDLYKNVTILTSSTELREVSFITVIKRRTMLHPSYSILGP